MVGHKKKVVILDRDGVINKDSGYIGKIEDFEFLPRVLESALRLQEKGYTLIIITNQSGIAKGYYTNEDYRLVTDYMLNTFAKKKVTIAKVYYCPHHPKENCLCRKPKTGMLEQAIRDFNIDEEHSWIVGDKLSDIQIADNTTFRKILLQSVYTQNLPQQKWRDLADATEYILQHS